MASTNQSCFTISAALITRETLLLPFSSLVWILPSPPPPILTSEVVQNAKSHDSQAMSGCEVFMRLSNVLKGPCIWVDDLDVGSQVLIAPKLAELAESLVCHLANVQFMVSFVDSLDIVIKRCSGWWITDGEQVIVVKLIENVLGKLSIDRSSVTKASSIMQVALR